MKLETAADQDGNGEQRNFEKPENAAILRKEVMICYTRY
jgi:hypothetical protein